MAKQTNQRIRIRPVTRLLLMASLGLGLAASPIWAGQASSAGSTGKTKNKQTSSSKGAASAAQKPDASKETPSSSTNSSSWVGKRDPFKLPEIETGSGHAESEAMSGGPLPAGERGLVISRLSLEGTVRDIPENKMLAVVSNETKRAYFLRENQSVYDGVVSKITMDSVTFTENVLDAEGHVTTREVVKRLNSASGEGR